MAATMNAVTFMGKNFSTTQNFIMNSRDLTLKQMFDVTAKLVSEQEEINNVDKIHWKNHSWRQLSLTGHETVINLQRAKVYVFSDSVLCLGRILQHPDSNEAWKKRIEGVMSEKSYRDYDGINGEPTEFEWNIFPGVTTLQLCGKVNDLLRDLGEAPETFTGRILFLSMFNGISCDRKDNKDECLKNAESVKVFARRFGIGQWSFIGPGSEKKWYSSENSPQGACDVSGKLETVNHQEEAGLQSVFPVNLALSSRSLRLTRIQFSCIPHVAPRHRGNLLPDTMERVGKFVVHHHSGILELMQGLHDAAAAAVAPAATVAANKKNYKQKTFVNKQLEPKAQSFLAARRCLS